MSGNTQTFAWRHLGGWLSAALLTPIVGLIIYWQVVPFDIQVAPQDGQGEIDPRQPVSVRTVGLGGRLLDVEVKDSQGNTLSGRLGETDFETRIPLKPDTLYTVSAEATRDWTNQVLTRTVSFKTITTPRLLAPSIVQLRPDRTLVLKFDRPVGGLEVKGFNFAVQSTGDQTFTLKAQGDYSQGKTFPFEVEWTTARGVPLAPLKLQVRTPPPLTVRLNVRGLEGVGLVLPVLFTFSESLQDRKALAGRIRVRAADAEVPGQWSWVSKRRLQFSPNPGWPALSTVRVSADLAGEEAIRATGGGWIEDQIDQTFTTGADRRIIVYLDTQRAEAIEAGTVVRSFPVSSGKTGTPTVTGRFYIDRRYERKTMRSRAKPGQPGYYVVENVPYAQFFHGAYAFHGAWWHNSFGRPASHGCVNLSTQAFNKRWPNARDDARWLWDWANLGVPVIVRATTPRTAAAETAQL